MTAALAARPGDNAKSARLGKAPLDREGLVEKIAARIRTAIFEQQLRPGDRILELELSRELNVSRTPIREALRWLEREGLVRREPYRGACVAFMTEEEIRNVFRIRAVLEAMAVEAARKRATAADLGTLRKRITGMRRAAARHDLSTFNAHDMAFHQYVWKLSGDGVLENVLNFLCHQSFVVYNSQTLALMNRRELETLVDTHVEFLGILEDGSGKVTDRLRRVQNYWIDLMVGRLFGQSSTETVPATPPPEVRQSTRRR